MQRKKLSPIWIAVIVALPLTLLLRLEWVSWRGRSCVQEVLARGESGSCRISSRAWEYLAEASASDGETLSSKVVVSRGKLNYRWQHTVEVTRAMGTRLEHWDGNGYAVGSIILADQELRQATSDKLKATP